VLDSWRRQLEKKGLMNKDLNKGFYAIFRDKIDSISSFNRLGKLRIDDVVEEKKPFKDDRFFSAFNSASLDRPLERKGKESSTSRHLLLDRPEPEDSKDPPPAPPKVASSSTSRDFFVKKETADLGSHAQPPALSPPVVHKIHFDIKFEEDDDEPVDHPKPLSLEAVASLDALPKLEAGKKEGRDRSGDYLNKREEEDLFVDDYDDDDLFEDAVKLEDPKKTLRHAAEQAAQKSAMALKVEEVIRAEHEQMKAVSANEDSNTSNSRQNKILEDMDEGEELNSDDDISDYNEDFDTGDNLLLGYYVKSKRKKDKRKIVFRHCVLRINGQEQVIQHARGEFKWAVGIRDK